MSASKKTVGEVMAGVGRMIDELERRLQKEYGAYFTRIGAIDWGNDTIQVAIRFDRDRLPL
jgi:hypothetical protein